MCQGYVKVKGAKATGYWMLFNIARTLLSLAALPGSLVMPVCERRHRFAEPFAAVTPPPVTFGYTAAIVTLPHVPC